MPINRLLSKENDEKTAQFFQRILSAAMSITNAANKWKT